MSSSTRFAIQLAVTAAGAILDYLVGRLTNKLTLGIICWALLTLAAAATLDFVKDVWHDHKAGGSSNGNWNAGGNGIITVAGIIRGRIDHFRWATVVNAIIAGALAGVASYAFTAAVITFRLLATQNGPVLGSHSPYDQSAIAFISNFQASSTTAWFIVACFAIALILRPPVVLPLGIAAVSVANAVLIATPQLSPRAPTLATQLAYSLSTPDGWLLRLPAKSVLLGCVVSFAIGVLACGMASRRISR